MNIYVPLLLDLLDAHGKNTDQWNQRYLTQVAAGDNPMMAGVFSFNRSLD